MAVLFLLLAFLLVVAIGAVGLENTDSSSVTLFDRSFSQLSEGQLLVLAAGLGFLVALFLFLSFGASRTRRSRRKELRSRRRDAEGRVGELERENERLQQELTTTRAELETVDRNRSDALAERDRAEASADRVRAAAGPTPAEASAHDRAVGVPPEPTRVQRERLDDRTGAAPAPSDEEARRR